MDSVDSCSNNFCLNAGRFLFFVSHSQTTITCQPMFSKAATLSLSRCKVRLSFFSQYSVLVLGRIWACLHVGHPCQKQPCTNITVLYFGIMISGFPGKSRRCNRKRYPKLCNSFLTHISGVVLALCTLDIISLRFSGSNMSGIIIPR